MALVSRLPCEYHRGMESRPVRYPLGALSSIFAETFGEPGRRTFRLVLKAGAANISVWLEKEQLFQLGVSLQEAVRRLSAEQRDGPSASNAPEWSGEELSLEFKARQMQLKYETSGNAFYLEAYEGDDEDREQDPGQAPGQDREEASVSCGISISQSAALAEEALKICAAGRPPCFLCGLPIAPQGHICPRANGHAVMESG